MKILLTGATGFLGKKLLSLLLTENVVIISRQKNDICKSRTSYQLDIDEKANYVEALKGVDVVIHCAGRAHIMNDDEDDPLLAFRRVNTYGTLNLARQAADAGVKRFIFISTIKVNGEQTYGKPFLPTDKFLPSDPYAVSKYQAEQGLLKLAKEADIELVIIRPPLIYGEGVKANFAFLMKLSGKGIPLPFRAIKYNKRSLVSVYNLVDLIKVCIDHPRAANQVFLVSDDNDLSTSQMVALMAKVQGKANLSVPVPVWCFKLAAKIFKKDAVADRLLGSLQVDIEHTKNTLDWAPPYTVEHGFTLAAKKWL